MLSIFAISGLINGLLSLGFGFFIILHNRKDRLNQLYFLLTISISIWALSYWRWLSSTNENTALFWVRMLSIGSTLIPVFYFHWIVYFLGINNKEKRAIKLTYVLVFIFLIFSFSSLFIKSVRQKLFFPFWPDPGVLYSFYLFFVYILLILYSINLLLKNYKTSFREKKGQIIYVFIGSIIAVGGGFTNFFLWYDILIPPYGNFLVALFPFLFGYAIFKHRLFNFRILATEFFTFAIWSALLIKVLLSQNTQDLAINILFLIWMIVFGVFLIRSVIKEVKQKEQIEAMAEDVEKAYEVEKKARKELQRLNRAKDQFIMATQHHLRTPLTSMQGYLDLIFDGSYGKVPEKLKETLKKFQISTKNEIRTVNELLDISQFQLGKEVVRLEENINIETMLKEIIEELQFETEKKNIFLKLEKPEQPFPQIKADSQKLKVALFNVVDNAIKYTKKGGVTIQLEIEDDKLRIIIKDTGMGIPKEEINTLFKKTFERGKEAVKVWGPGKGIGLFLTFQIIKAHKGRIWAESEGKDKGSTFFVELPVG